MFSRRTAWDREPNAWTRALERRRASGEELLDLSISNPAACGLGWNEELLRDRLAVPGTAAHAPEALGLPSAREAIAAWWTDRGVPAHPERTCLTASTSEAYAFLFRLLCEPGDLVAVPRPSYPLFDFLTGLEELEARPYPLRLDDGRWRLDLEQLADGLTERTRAVLVVHPNNPTGSRLTEGDARALVRLCAERSLALISDEVFAEFPWSATDAHAPHGLLSLADEEGALVFALSGLSKVAGLAQLKLAWIAVGGPEALRDEALARLELIADTYLSVASPVQLAAGRLLAASEDFRRRCLTRVRGNLETLRASGLQLLPGEAGWSAILELPPSVPEERFAVALLEDHGLVVHPGGFFGLGLSGHFVVSLLTEPEILARGLALLACRLNGATSA
jgi:aspartate/methionine/tyrosine aminotransferase